METKANYAMVGAFTLAVIAAAFGFVFWFSGPSKTATRKNLEIVFDGSVSGLSNGASVLFNGLRVGAVTGLALAPDNPAEVVARISVDKSTPIKADTKARLEFTGLTGVASVALFGGSPTAPPLEIPDDAPVPVIHADSSQFQNLVETAQRIAKQADEMVTKLNKLVDDNAGNVASTLRNVNAFSDALAANAGGLKDFFGAMADIGKAAKPLTVKMGTLADDADTLVKSIEPGKVRSILDNVQVASAKLGPLLDGVNGFLGNSANGDSKGMFAEVGEAAKSIKKLADNLDVRTKEIAANINRFAGPGLRQYEALAVDGRRTLDDISRAVKSLEANPSQIIWGAKSKVPEVSSTR
jgi:phospholipid/cholesterol/gamma-HCH transport system substrate-binding protein